MPKGPRKRLQAPRKRVWQDDDVFELLAWLDFCVARGMDFERTIIKHLKTTTGKDFSESQVSDKLARECKNYGREGSGTVEDLRSEGSIFLDGYTEDDRENIREAISRIGQLGSSRYRLRSSSSELRLRSRTISKPPQRSEKSNFATDVRLEHENPPGAQASSREGVDQEMTGIELSTATSSALQGKRADRDQSSPVSTLGEIKGELCPASRLNSCTNRSIPITYVHTAVQMMPMVADAEVQIEDLGRELANKTRQLEANRKENTAQKNYITTLSNRLSAAQAECEEIQHCTRAAASHMDDVEMLRNLRYENSILKHQLEEKRRQRQGFDIAETNSLGPSRKEILEELDWIKIQITDACSSIDVATTLSANIECMEQSNKNLDLWTQRVASCSFRQFLSFALEKGASELDVFKLLAAVGVCEMTFESDFPHFMASESPLLDQYRKQILTRDGPEGLFYLDLLAHKSLMSESYVQSQILSDCVKVLANQLCDALHPLISSTSGPLSVHSRQTSPLEHPAPGLGGTMYTDLPGYSANEIFHECFLRALTLKYKLALSNKKYKLVFFKPGDWFDADTMTRNGDISDHSTPRRKDSRADAYRKHEAQNKCPIKMCLFPALYSGPDIKHDLNRSVGLGIDHCLVEYYNFEADEAGENTQGFTLVVKAVVVVS